MPHEPLVCRRAVRRVAGDVWSQMHTAAMTELEFTRLEAFPGVPGTSNEPRDDLICD